MPDVHSLVNKLVCRFSSAADIAIQYVLYWYLCYEGASKHAYSIITFSKLNDTMGAAGEG